MDEANSKTETSVGVPEVTGKGKRKGPIRGGESPFRYKDGGAKGKPFQPGHLATGGKERKKRTRREGENPEKEGRKRGESQRGSPRDGSKRRRGGKRGTGKDRQKRFRLRRPTYFDIK